MQSMPNVFAQKINLLESYYGNKPVSANFLKKSGINVARRKIICYNKIVC